MMVGRYGTSATTADITISATDTSDLHGDYYEYEKTDVEEKIQNILRKEELNIPSFKVALKLRNNIKPISNVALKQHNIRIRNTL